MKHTYLAPAIAALMTTAAASPAAAAITIYTINFHVQDIAGPSTFLLGSFKVSLDPDTIPYVNDAQAANVDIFTSFTSFGDGKVDYYPVDEGGGPGFLIGWDGGGSDTNNVLLAVPDYRVRFILDEALQLVSARGAYVYQPWGGNPMTFGFDTGAGSGRVEHWEILVEGGSEPDPGPAVPEPATWTMLIAGFGIVGTAMRRRRQAVSA